MSLISREIYPKIFVYDNLFKDINSTLDIIKESEINPEGSVIGPWESWYTFGIEADRFDNNRKQDERSIKENAMLDEIKDIFYKTVDDYFEKNNVKYTFDTFFDKIDNEEKPMWKTMGPSICKYEPDSSITDTLIMHYHTDYQVEKKDSRGYNFAVTVTMYLNDDYDGGGLDFYINDKLFYYKPKAGDVIVFPSGDPGFLTDGEELYHHGVRKVLNVPKYFIRNNMLRFNEGSEEWLRNQELYGKEIWAEMEREKWKKEISEGKYQTINEEEFKQKARRINDI